jgi:hypothetical protein
VAESAISSALTLFSSSCHCNYRRRAQRSTQQEKRCADLEKCIKRFFNVARIFFCGAQLAASRVKRLKHTGKLHHYPQGTRSTKGDGGDGCTTLTRDYQIDRFIFCACAWSLARATCCAQLGSIPMEPFKSSNLNGLRRNETTCPHPAKFISEMDCSCQTPLCTNSRTEQPEAQYHNSHRLNIT